MIMTGLVERFYEAYNRHDIHAVREMYARHAVHHEVPQGRRGEGRDAIVAGFGHFLSAFPDARWEPTWRVVQDDSAAVAYRLTGTLGATLGPFTTLGRALDIEGVHLLEARDGALVATADYWDSATFARQMQGGT
jgi:steroid delta-isomerase-like uncharacterized protein